VKKGVTEQLTVLTLLQFFCSLDPFTMILSEVKKNLLYLLLVVCCSFMWIIVLMKDDHQSFRILQNNRKLSLRENIHSGLQFLHLEGPTVSKDGSSHHSISFLEPEKIRSHQEHEHKTNSQLMLKKGKSLVSQAMSMLDLSPKIKEKVEVASDANKAVSPVEFMDLHSPSVQTPTKALDKPNQPIESTSTKNILFHHGTIDEGNQNHLQSEKKERKGRRNKKKKDIENSLSHITINTQLDSAESEAFEGHPPISPRLGTDISSQHHESLLLCPNQSKCIVPELQLKKKFKIYFCKHPVSYGVRFYFLAREGFLLHPNVELVRYEAIDTADYIVYLPGSAPWHKTECNLTSYAPKLIVLDEFDGHTLFLPTRTKEEYVEKYGSIGNPWYFQYFKRSFVRRNDGKFTGYPHLNQYETYPMVYAVAEAYVSHHFIQQREIDILCTLRGSKHMTTRLRAQTWVAEYAKERNVANVISSQVRLLIVMHLDLFLSMFLNFFLYRWITQTENKLVFVILIKCIILKLLLLLILLIGKEISVYG
jgi:hypothetical protein